MLIRIGYTSGEHISSCFGRIDTSAAFDPGRKIAVLLVIRKHTLPVLIRSFSLINPGFCDTGKLRHTIGIIHRFCFCSKHQKSCYSCHGSQFPLFLFHIKISSCFCFLCHFSLFKSTKDLSDFNICCHGIASFSKEILFFSR